MSDYKSSFYVMDIYVYLSILGIELIFCLEMDVSFFLSRMAVSYSFAIVCQMLLISCFVFVICSGEAVQQ